MATFTHRAGGNTRVTWALALFLVLSLLTVGAWRIYCGIITPPSRTITCERVTGRCIATGMIDVRDEVPLSIEGIAALNVRRDGDDAWLARDRDYWSVETTEPAEAAALDSAVAELRAFAAGEGERVTVTIPNGPTRDVWIGLIAMLAGLLQALWLRGMCTGARVDVDERVAIVVSRGLGPAVHRSVERAAVRAVKQWKAHRGRFLFVCVELDVDGQPPVLVAREHASPASEAATLALANGIRSALASPAPS